MGKIIDKIEDRHLILILIFTFLLLMSAFVGYVIFQLQTMKDSQTEVVETALVEFYNKYELSVNCNP